jgi:subtilisin
MSGFNPFWRRVTQRIRQQGVLPVFAIGNEGIGTSRSPGNYPEALSVGAIDFDNRIAGFSSSIRFNRPEEPEQPNVVAPGVDVFSARPGGGGQFMSGTSFRRKLMKAEIDPRLLAQVEQAGTRVKSRRW